MTYEEKTYEEKTLVTIKYLESLGNDPHEAVDILANLMHDCCMDLPQRCHYSKEYCDLKKKQKHTALVQLRKLPYGEDIIKEETRLMLCR